MTYNVMLCIQVLRFLLAMWLRLFMDLWKNWWSTMTQSIRYKYCMYRQECTMLFWVQLKCHCKRGTVRIKVSDSLL